MSSSRQHQVRLCLWNQFETSLNSAGCSLVIYWETASRTHMIQIMAESIIYTRVYFNGSAEHLVVAKKPQVGPLSQEALSQELRNHAAKDNQTPMAFISCNDRIVDTAQRTFNMHFCNGDSATESWITFNQIPGDPLPIDVRLNSAIILKEKCEQLGEEQYKIIGS